MSLNDLSESKSFYKNNPDFKCYVDKDIKMYNRTLDEALLSPITENYRKSLMDGGCNAKKKRKEGENE